ncbi:hypothetical protein [Yersinia bercovieri]|uniref:hypothetical protein n=1 Tax=Yersinia bercovieri TaxID=634 RepID=UPI0021BD860E|nr:hypothetical protein [Yersinia bercovieri]
MNHRNTLNTRLLPLSILISSLVSGGAMAASGAAPEFDESKYTAVTTSGTKVQDTSIWSGKLKAEYDEIEQQINDLTKSQKEAEEQLNKGEEYAEHEKTVTDLKSAPKKKDDAIQAVTDGARSITTDTTKLDATTKPKETALIAAITDQTDQTKVQGLIAEVRTQQEAYHVALTDAKSAITNGIDTITSTEAKLTDLEAKKDEFIKAVSALESATVDVDKVLGEFKKTELAEFYTELDFEDNKAKLETAHNEIDAFKDLLVKKKLLLQISTNLQRQMTT